MNCDVAQQDHADQAVRTFQQFFGIACAATTVLGHMPQTVAIERHQRGFGTGEKPGRQNQKKQSDEQCSEWEIVQGRGLEA